MKRINRKSSKIITSPSVYPVNLDMVKTYLRIDDGCDDDLLRLYIKSATKTAENYCGRFFINTVIEYTMDGFSDFPEVGIMASGIFEGHKQTIYGNYGEFTLPYRPVVSVASIKTFDEKNNESTVSSSVYSLDKNSGRIYLNDGQVWPTSLRSYEAVKVTYTAGYGETDSVVPAPISQAILELVGKMYECRGGCDMPASCKDGLSQYRILDGNGWV